MNSWTKLLLTATSPAEEFFHNPSRISAQDDAVVLIQGPNEFGERVYVYLKLNSFFFIETMQKLEKKEKFDLREYGEVVAAGRGEPTYEIQKKFARLYDMLPYEKKSSK